MNDLLGQLLLAAPFFIAGLALLAHEIAAVAVLCNTLSREWLLDLLAAAAVLGHVAYQFRALADHDPTIRQENRP